MVPGPSIGAVWNAKESTPTRLAWGVRLARSLTSRVTRADVILQTDALGGDVRYRPTGAQ